MRGFSIQKKLLFLSVWSLFFLLIQFTVANASPRQITYKDYLKDPGTGTPYNGTYWVEYRLYNASTGGTVQFCEIQSVTIDNGNIFSHIGKATTGGIPDLVFLPPDEDYLQVAVGTSLSGSTGSDPTNSTPCLYTSLTNQLNRIELDAAAYVHPAKKADDADTCTLCSDADTLDGYNSSDFSSAVHTHNYLLPGTCSNNQVVKWNGTAWVCSADVDTNTNTLGGLSCANGQGAKGNGSGWACAADIDTDTNTDALAGLSCANAQIPKWNGTAWA